MCYGFFLQVSRDPRFDDLSGRFNENMFEKAYSFLDDIRSQEKEVNNCLAFVVCPSVKFFFSIYHY